MNHSLRRRAVLGGGVAALATPLIIGRRASAADKSITVDLYRPAGRHRPQADHPTL